jgi:hypothetical protein
MNSFPRLLCLAALATATAFAQTPNSSEVHALPAAMSGNPELQLRSIPEHTVLPTATVLRLKLNRSISTATARPGQQFTGTVTKPVEVDGRTIIPSGAEVNCEVKQASGARRFAGKPALAIKANSVRMPNGEQLSFSASVVDTGKPHQFDVDEEGRVRGSSPNPMNKIETGALAGAGAVAGAVIAGPEGLLIGTASGVLFAAGHIIVKHNDLTLPAGTELIFELDAPASVSRPQMGGMQ